MSVWRLLVVYFLSANLTSCSEHHLLNDETDSSSGADTDTDGESFTCLAVEPGALSTRVDSEFTVIGVGFQAGLKVGVTETTSSDEVDLGEAVIAGLRGAIFNASAGRVEVGTYRVTLTNPNQKTTMCPDTIDWLDLMPPSVARVTPPSSWTGLPGDEVISDKQVVIEGSDFEETPMVTWVDMVAPDQRYPAAVVLFDNTEQLDAVCPSETGEMPEGLYLVEVTNPSGLGAYWNEGGARREFEIVSIPPPSIDEVTPFRSPAAEDVTLSVTGNYFQDRVTVQIEMQDNTLHDLSTSYLDTNNLTAVLPAGILSKGIYPIRVTNPDAQYDVYYSYEATPSSFGHLDSFETISEVLNTARWRHGSVEGFDVFSNAYLYTAGGIDADGNVLDDVEVIPVSTSGDPGVPWIAEQWIDENTPRAVNALKIPRQGFSLVRAGGWLYAAGGIDVDTSVAEPIAEALDSVERARILGLDTSPAIASAKVTTGGSLEVGTWYYRVSAVGSWGESIPSELKMIPGANGTVHLAWSAVAGAKTYNIYRNIDPTGNGGVTYLLANGITGTSFKDNGARGPGEDSVTPLPLGSLGRWEVLDSALMNSPREGLDAVVINVPSGEEAVDGQTFLFAVGGRPDATGLGYLATGERAEVLDDGTLGSFEMLSYDLNTSRAFYVLLTNQGQSIRGRSYPLDTYKYKCQVGSSDPLLLLAIAGDDEYTSPKNTGLPTLEISEIVSADGDNDAWTTQSASVPAGRATHGHGALVYFDFLFTFGGVDRETLGGNPSQMKNAASRFEYHGAAGDNDILQNYQSTSASFETSRSYYEMVRLNGYNFVIGGNDKTGPVASIERTLQ